MKFSDLSEFQRKCIVSKMVKRLKERNKGQRTPIHTFDYNMGYSDGFLAGANFYENKSKKTRQAGPSKTGG
jgi:hypothetical protein